MANIITKGLVFTEGNAYFVQAVKGTRDFEGMHINNFPVLGERKNEKEILDSYYNEYQSIRMVAYNITGYSTRIWGVDLEDFIRNSKVLEEGESRKNLITRTITAYKWKFGKPSKDNTTIDWKRYTTGDKLTSKQANKKAQENGYLFAIEDGEEKTLRGMTEEQFYWTGREVTR